MGSNIKNKHRKLKICCVFHYNQNTVPYAQHASEVCYSPVTRILFESDYMKQCAIQISGTLLTALHWADPEPVSLLKQGILNGKFELLGSTYAQNVMFSTPNYQNELQIEEHQKVLKSVFGVIPKGFWNPERCWKNCFSELLLHTGYEYTFLEEHIFKESQMMCHKIPFFSDLGVLIIDDRFTSLVNYAIWSGDFAPALAYILEKYESETAHLCYAEDVESVALWPSERGASSETCIDNLNKFLEAVIKTGIAEFSSGCDIISTVAHEQCDRIPEQGQANWMNYAIEFPEKQYHEPGFKDWFDFNGRSEKLKKYRVFFDRVYEDYQKCTVQKPAACSLKESGRRILAAHQYEFGCVGIGNINTFDWDCAGIAQGYFKLAESIERGFYQQTELYGGKCVIIFNDFLVAVISQKNGNILNLIDLKRGEDLACGHIGQSMQHSAADLHRTRIRDNEYHETCSMQEEKILAEHVWFKHLLPPYLVTRQQCYYLGMKKHCAVNKKEIECCPNALEIKADEIIFDSVSENKAEFCVKHKGRAGKFMYTLEKNRITLEIFNASVEKVSVCMLPSAETLYEQSSDVFEYLISEERNEIGIKNNLTKSFFKIKYSQQRNIERKRLWCAEEISFFPADSGMCLEWKVM